MIEPRAKGLYRVPRLCPRGPELGKLADRTLEGTESHRSPSPGAKIAPFRIAVPQADLDDLRSRLVRTRWPDELRGVGWRYGVPLDYLRGLLEYWRTSYDWRKQEARLNELSQFTTTIDGANVHFLHVRSQEPKALPLIMTHGWPGSFVEFLNVIGPLTNPQEHGGDPSDAFHLVIPSIPGFGFSGPTQGTGWTPKRIAGAWAHLMARLGYGRYGAQGGDWGSGISRELGLQDGDRVVGVHVNTLGTFPSSDPTEMALLTEDEKKRLERLNRFRIDGLGYAAIQSTRPETLAYGLTDSPAGQLAWIVEKFREWTDSSERPEDAVDRDQMLTNVMVYWLTKTAGSAARIYREFAQAGQTWGKQEPSVVPMGVAVFPHDMSPPVRRFAERDNKNIVQWSEFDRGGHFAAMEEPDLLVDDVRKFFRRFR
jgi:epoxide hydrolase